MAVECIISLLPDSKAFGRVYRYITFLSLIPNLKWTNPDQIADQKYQQKLNKESSTQTHAYNLRPRRTVNHE